MYMNIGFRSLFADAAQYRFLYVLCCAAWKHSHLVRYTIRRDKKERIESNPLSFLSVCKQQIVSSWVDEAYTQCRLTINDEWTTTPKRWNWCVRKHRYFSFIHINFERFMSIKYFHIWFCTRLVPYSRTNTARYSLIFFFVKIFRFACTRTCKE